MKQIINGIIHLLAAIFLFFIIGMAVALLLIQSQFLDMRFDSEMLITVMIFSGVWFFLARVFMNARPLALWEKSKLSIVLTLLSSVIILGITILGGSIKILPAYMVRKAVFLETALTLDDMNIFLIVSLLIGFVMLLLSHRNPVILTKETKMDWHHMTKGNRAGMMILYVIIALFTLVYLGQGGVNSMLNDSIMYLKNADVEGFRDYLLSFGPLAAIVSALLMVFQSIIAPLPAFVITFSNGLMFGWFFGAILSWSSAMLGAVLCFFIAKYLGRPVVEKIVTKKALDWWDRFFAKYGKHSIFIARLLPIVSFDLVSYTAGVTSVSFWQFFWATGLGQLPATILYSYLGQNATDTVKILFFMFTIVIALAVIGMLLRPKLNSMIANKRGVKS